MQWLARFSPLYPVIKLLEEIKLMATDINAAIAQITADVAAQKTTIDGFIAFEKGLATAAAKELALAKSLGATDAQLAGLTALHASISANSQTLADAMTTNTPTAAPATPAAPVEGTPVADAPAV